MRLAIKQARRFFTVPKHAVYIRLTLPCESEACAWYIYTSGAIQQCNFHVTSVYLFDPRESEACACCDTILWTLIEERH